jgi:hypothetical protein
MLSVPPPLPHSSKPPKSCLASVCATSSAPSRLTRLPSSCTGPRAPSRLGDATHPPPASARLCSGEDRASPPMSTTLSLSLLSGSSWSSKPSHVGSMMSSGCHRQDLIDSRSAFASQQPRHSQRSTREPRVGVALVHALATRKHAASWAASASQLGPRSLVVGHDR